LFIVAKACREISRLLLFENSIDIEKLDRQLADGFINKKINNNKGTTFERRFVDILSDPSNLFITRCAKAGKVVGDNIVLHNNILVSKNGYYGQFSDILYLNKGVHEPAEERMFSEALKYIPEGGTMVELGSYWAFYSMWFYKEITNADVYCIEPNKNYINVGINNFKLNSFKGDFTQGAIGNGNTNIDINNFIIEKNIECIDILHSDIQGSELVMLNSISSLLDDKKIRYLFISTHSQNIHFSCLELLQMHNYRIIADADFDNETFCSDGIIVSCHKNNLDIPYTSLGNRQHTPLRMSMY